MPALTLLDAAMFLFESPQRHFNVGPLVVLDPPLRQRSTFADRLHARMLKRPAAPPFTYRLRPSAAGLPSLEEDPDFDLERHVHRVTLKEPGGTEQLVETVSALHEQQFDRKHPLWACYVIDGLKDGKVAVFGKMHHGVIDGRTFVGMISNWLALSASDRVVRAMWEGLPQRPARDATPASLIQRVGGGLGRAARTATTAASLSRMLAGQALSRVGLGSVQSMMLPFTDIPKVLRGRPSTRRSFAYCLLPMADLKVIGKAHGASVNDMLLLTLDLALARYLDGLGTRPDKPLVTAMPVALEGAKGGNQIAVLQFPLGAPGESAPARLESIRRHVATIKAVVKNEASATVMMFTALVHGVPAILEKLGVNGGIPVSNIVMSNPFGMPEKRYLMGAAAEFVLPVSLVNAGQTLNITAVTLGDSLQLAFQAIPEAVPDLRKLARYTREALEELPEALASPKLVKLPGKRRKGAASGTSSRTTPRSTSPKAARTPARTDRGQR